MGWHSLAVKFSLGNAYHFISKVKLCACFYTLYACDKQLLTLHAVYLELYSIPNLGYNIIVYV